MLNLVGQMNNSNKFRKFPKYIATKLWIFCRENKIDEFFSFNEIIELTWEINNNKNCLINIFDNLDKINLKNKTKWIK